jgi:hypothetical protein
MQKFDKALIRKYVRGGLAQYSFAHPEKAISPSTWGSIAERIAGPIWAEHRLRFGDAPDRLLEEWLIRQWLRRIKRDKSA